MKKFRRDGEDHASAPGTLVFFDHTTFFETVECSRDFRNRNGRFDLSFFLIITVKIAVTSDIRIKYDKIIVLVGQLQDIFAGLSIISDHNTPPIRESIAQRKDDTIGID